MGPQIEHYRKSKQMSRKQLADAVGVTRNAVWRWENEDTQPTSDKVPVVAEALGVEPGKLFEPVPGST